MPPGGWVEARDGGRIEVRDGGRIVSKVT